MPDAAAGSSRIRILAIHRSGIQQYVKEAQNDNEIWNCTGESREIKGLAAGGRDPPPAEPEDGGAPNGWEDARRRRITSL